MYYKVQYHGSGWRTWCIVNKPKQTEEMIEMLKKQEQDRVRIKMTNELVKSDEVN